MVGAVLGAVISLISLLFWLAWLSELHAVYVPAGRRAARLVLGAAPALCVLAFVVIFSRFGDAETISDSGYFLGFSGLCGLTLRLGLKLFELTGVQARADAVERGNSAVIAPVVAGLVGVTALNVGSNIGYGDDVTTTLCPLGVALALFVAFACAAAHMTGLGDAITVERDRAAGLRFASACVAASLAPARAAAGDWVSLSATLLDQAGAVPVLIAVLLFTRGVERRLPRSSRAQSLTLVAGHLAFAAVALGLPLASEW